MELGREREGGHINIDGFEVHDACKCYHVNERQIDEKYVMDD